MQQSSGLGGNELKSNEALSVFIGHLLLIYEYETLVEWRLGLEL
jgi:hypothetical protein